MKIGSKYLFVWGKHYQYFSFFFLIKIKHAESPDLNNCIDIITNFAPQARTQGMVSTESLWVYWSPFDRHAVI